MYYFTNKLTPIHILAYIHIHIIETLSAVWRRLRSANAKRRDGDSVGKSISLVQIVSRRPTGMAVALVALLLVFCAAAAAV